MTAPPLHGACACGGVTVTLARMPGYVLSCNCTLCRRLGGAWVYDRPDAVTITGETRGFVRPDMPEPDLTIHFCPVCSATIAWTMLPAPGDRMGLNAGLFPAGTFDGLEARFPDNLNDAGTGDRPPPRRAPGVVGRDLWP